MDPGDLLDRLSAFVRRYVVVGEHELTAVTLWIVHTHAVEATGITPYLAISSPEKGSGKTLLLEVLELLVARPWLTGSVTGATLARKIHQDHPTLLLDESDAAFRGDREYAEALRGILNSGFKASGTYSRCVGLNGSNLRVQDFSTFSAKAIAGIGFLMRRSDVLGRWVYGRVYENQARQTGKVPSILAVWKCRSAHSQ